MPTLIVVAHGSRNTRATDAIRDLADEVRRQRPGLTVTACFLDHATPRLSDVVAALRGPAVVVPLLLTAAYHSEVDIPAQLRGATHPIVQSEVLGPHPLLLDALEHRLREVGVTAGDPDTAVVLAAAGSSDAQAADVVREFAREWARRGWRAVEAGFASAAEPTVEQAVELLRRRGAPRVAVATYLLAPGLFLDRLRRSGADRVSAPLGAAPEVAALVLERYDRAVAGSRPQAQ